MFAVFVMFLERHLEDLIVSIVIVVKIRQKKIVIFRYVNFSLVK